MSMGASKLDNPMLPTMLIRDVIAEAMASDGDILASALVDVVATYGRDPACEDISTPFLFFKGFHALQAHRVAHWLWGQGRHTLAPATGTRRCGAACSWAPAAR